MQCKRKASIEDLRVNCIMERVASLIVKKKFLIIILIILASIILIYIRHSKDLYSEKECYIIDALSINYLDLIPCTTIKLPNSRFNEHGFTCTGMDYDPVDDCFWVGNYGRVNSESSDLKPSVVKLSRDMQILEEFDYNIIELDESNKNVQGVAYDTKTDSIWVSGGNRLVNISKDGNRIGDITINGFECMLNGLAYDRQTDTFWILCYKEYLLNIDRNGNVLRKIICDVKDQDHLAFSANGELYFNSGADYKGYNNYLYRIDTKTESITACYVLKESYAIEGMCFIDKMLYVMNDGYYHDSLIKENLVNVYPFD